MSGFLGKGRKGNANTITKYTQLDVQTSAQGLPIPIGWGKFRVAPNLIDTGNFQAIPQTSGGGKGGGGKGGKSNITGYDYRAAVIMALCEGPIQGLGTAWRSRDSMDYAQAAAQGYVPNTLFLGTRDQAVWGWLTTASPSHALSYSSTAYIADSNLDLGSSPTLPNYGFEVIGTFSGTIADGLQGDANPADVINDFLTNPQYGVGFGPAVGQPGSFIDAPSWTLYGTYCLAQGLKLSPTLESQEQVRSIIDRWATVTNSWIFWSGGALKFVPLGDAPVVGFGAGYTPNLTPAYDLGYEDFVVSASGTEGKSPEPPVSVRRIDPAAAPNSIKFEILYRGYSYQAFPIEWRDDGLIGQYGVLPGPSVEAHDIKEISVGQTVAQLIGQRNAYLRNGDITFRLGWEFCLLEPGDLLTLTEPHLGMDRFPVRVKQLDEDKDGVWTVIAEEFPGALGNASGNTAQAPEPIVNRVNALADPGNVNPPAILEPQAPFIVGHQAEVWIAASGGANWGGCNVFLAFDGVNFNPIGEITNPARQGVLTAPLADHVDPDTADTIAVDLSESFGSLDLNATHDDADFGRTLCYVTEPFTTTAPCDGELLAYGHAVAGSAPYLYDLSYLRRGLYGSTPAGWAAGSFFTRIDLSSSATQTTPSLLVYNLPAQYIGKELFFKFQSFNRFGEGVQDISALTIYTYTPCGHGFGTQTGGCPAAPTGLAASPEPMAGAVDLSWDRNDPADNVVVYKVYRAAGPGGSFGGAGLIATTRALNWVDSGLAAGTWTYFVTAQNAVCESGPSASVDATVTTGAGEDDDCADIQNVDSGTSYTVTLTKCFTQVVWNSTDPGDKFTYVAGASSFDRYTLDIKTTPGDGSNHCVIALDGTIGKQPAVKFVDYQCDLALRADGAKSDWIIRFLSCVEPMSAGAGAGAIGLDGWGISRTIVEKALPIPPFGPPQVTSNSGDVLITTTQPNTRVVLFASSSVTHSMAGSPTVSSVTSAGLTFAKDFQQLEQVAGFAGPADVGVEIWSARAPTPLTNHNIHIVFNVDIRSAIYYVFAVDGINPTTPWDPSGFFTATNTTDIPGSPTNNVSVPSVSTTNASDFAFAFFVNYNNPVLQGDTLASIGSAFPGQPIMPPGVGVFNMPPRGYAQTEILYGGSNLLGDWNAGVGYYFVTTGALSNVTFPVPDPGGAAAWIGVVGALQGASGSGSACDNALPLSCGCDGPAPDGTIVANITGAPADPTATAIDTVLDSKFGTEAGTLIMSDGGPWVALLPGGPGQVLTSQGADTILQWASPSSLSVDPVDIGLAAGASMDWGRLGDAVSGISDWGRIGSADPVTLEDALGRLSD